MEVILSGGDLGGTIVVVADGDTVININGFIYQIVGEQAVYIGTE
jgi:hypothetical protein